jgi:hypothetical protein
MPARPTWIACASGWRALADAAQPRPVAVGEIGLDLFIMGDPDIERQEYFFVEQLKIARDADLPVLLHVRRAVDQVLRNLRRIRVRGGIAHAFNGSRQQADEFIRLGFKLGFGGAHDLCRLDAHPPPGRVAAAGRHGPRNRCAGHAAGLAGGRRNTPVELPRITELLAELRGIDAGQLARATSSQRAGRAASVAFGSIDRVGYALSAYERLASGGPSRGAMAGERVAGIVGHTHRTCGNFGQAHRY